MPTGPSQSLIFQTAREILFRREHYRGMILIVYAPQGHGKTSFATQLLAQLYGEREVVVDSNGEKQTACVKPDWNAWKTWMKWEGNDFEKLLSYARTQKEQQLCAVWNDAGAQAHKNLRFEEWAKELARSYQMWRRWYAGIVLTTPDPTNLLNFLRGFTIYTGRVNMAYGPKDSPNKRYLRVYEGDITADFKKTFRRTFISEDWFNVMLPNDTFHEIDRIDRYYAGELLDREIEAGDRQGRKRVSVEELIHHTPGEHILAG